MCTVNGASEGLTIQSRYSVAVMSSGPAESHYTMPALAQWGQRPEAAEGSFRLIV